MSETIKFIIVIFMIVLMFKFWNDPERTIEQAKNVALDIKTAINEVQEQ